MSRQRLQPEWDAPAEEQPAPPDPPSPPAVPSEQPLRVLDYRTGLTEAQRARLHYLLNRDREAAAAEPSPAENLDELERDTRAGRDRKIDFRCAPDEKVAWSEAARVRGMTTSDWMRSVLNLAAREVLTEPVG